jgi:ABC-type transport system substrate-binding protein
MNGCVHWTLYIALLLVLSVSGLAAAQAPTPGGTLKVAWEADVTGFDPYLSPGVQAWHIGTGIRPSTSAARCGIPLPSQG